MSTTEQTLSVVREAFEALQAHDLDAFRALLSDEVVLRDPSTGALQSGPDVIVADMRGSMEVFPDYRPGVENLFADGEQAVAEIVRTGTNTGPLEMPGGPIPPTGRSVRLPECLIFRVRGGKIVSMTSYADQLHAMQELGLDPSQMG